MIIRLIDVFKGTGLIKISRLSSEIEEPENPVFQVFWTLLLISKAGYDALPSLSLYR